MKVNNRDISSGQTYNFNHIPRLIFSDEHVKSVKHTGLVGNILWVDILVSV